MSGEPVKLCRMKHDVGYAPQLLKAYGIQHDNYAACDSTHGHSFVCNLKHSPLEMPVAWLLVEGWLLLGCMWMARTINPKRTNSQ